jgi:hypothetical protein
MGDVIHNGLSWRLGPGSDGQLPEIGIRCWECNTCLNRPAPLGAEKDYAAVLLSVSKGVSEN